MNLALSEHEEELVGRAAAAFAHDTMPPSSSSFTDLCLVTREAGRAAPDRTFLWLAVARLVGWRGGPDITVALDPIGGSCPHVARAADVSTALVASRDGWVGTLTLADADLVARPTIDDAAACRVTFDPDGLTDRRDHDVAGAVALATILLGADCTGAAEAAFDATVDHVRTRPLRGGVLADRQVVRHRIADMATDLTRCRDVVLDAAARVDRGESPEAVALAASRTKVVLADRARSVTVEALRLAGGRGVLADEPWSRPYRRVKAAEPLFGSPRDHRAALARAALARQR